MSKILLTLWAELYVGAITLYFIIPVYGSYTCVSIVGGGLVLGIILMIIGSVIDARSSDRPGHCLCGYDLRGNVSGVCPECGKSIRDTLRERWRREHDPDPWE